MVPTVYVDNFDTPLKSIGQDLACWNPLLKEICSRTQKTRDKYRYNSKIKIIGVEMTYLLVHHSIHQRLPSTCDKLQNRKPLNRLVYPI